MYCTREINLMSRHKVYWSIPDKKFPLGGWKVAKLGDSPPNFSMSNTHNYRNPNEFRKLA